MVRFPAYVVAVVVAAYLGFEVGDASGWAVCGREADECSLAPMTAWYAAGVAVLLVLIGIAVLETRRRQREAGTGDRGNG